MKAEGTEHVLGNDSRFVNVTHVHGEIGDKIKILLGPIVIIDGGGDHLNLTP